MLKFFIYIYIFLKILLWFTITKKSRVGQAALHGVYFDDTKYDYLQHLRPIGESEGEAIFIEASKKEKKKGGNFELKKFIKLEDNKVR